MHYVYAYLDPTKPGEYRYNTPRREFVFDYEPFYVGKGVGDRMLHHLRIATTGKKSHFMHRIRKIRDSGFEPVVTRLGNLTIETTALTNEKKLIAAIGRRDLGLGPLCNLTDGGDGVSNLSSETRKRFSKARRKYFATDLGKQQLQAQVARLQSPEAIARRTVTRRAQAKTAEGRRSIERRAEKHRRFCKTEEGRAAIRRNQLAGRVSRLLDLWSITPKLLLHLRNKLDRGEASYAALSRLHGIPENTLYKLHTRRSYTDLDELVAFQSTLN